MADLPWHLVLDDIGKRSEALKRKKTKADYIRSMTDEELAEFIGSDPMHDICPNNCHDDLDRPCKVCVLDWLKQETKDA